MKLSCPSCNAGLNIPEKAIWEKKANVLSVGNVIKIPAQPPDEVPELSLQESELLFQPQQMPPPQQVQTQYSQLICHRFLFVPHAEISYPATRILVKVAELRLVQPVPEQPSYHVEQVNYAATQTHQLIKMTTVSQQSPPIMTPTYFPAEHADSHADSD